MISVRFQGKPFNIMVIQAYALTSNWRSWSWTVLWRPTRPSRTNTQKRCHFHYRGLECKNRKSRNTWNNGKFGLGVQNETGKRLIEIYQENTLIKANTLFQQHRTLHADITRWSILKWGWLYSLQPKMEKLYIVSKNKTGSWLGLRSWIPFWQIQI